MKTRRLLAAGLALPLMALAGCGSSSSKPAPVPKVENLTDADRAAYKAEVEKAADEERAQQAKEGAAGSTKGTSVEDEERAARRK